MALKDMKSDLSKFRMPKKEPLESKKREDIKSNQNQTPLSSLVDSAPKIPRSQTTTNKEGVNPNKVQQGDKFKGETSATPMDNSEKFLGETTPTRMSLEQRYLGQTTPEKMDNSPNYLGETNPQQMDNSEKFLGETTPNKLDSSERFLGETNPTPMDNSEGFLGETTPKPMSLEERFLGETTPNPSNLESKFLGETTPTPSDLESKFLGETDQKKFDNSSNYLGETDQSKFDNSSNYLGETTPTEMNNESQYLGETTPNSAAPVSQFLGETTPTPSDLQSKFLGETTPTTMNLSPNFLGETTPSPFKVRSNKDEQATEPKFVNFIVDSDGRGFSPYQKPMNNSTFVGVDPSQTQFDGSTPVTGQFTLKKYGVTLQSDNGIKDNYSDKVLKSTYNKFSLKEDSYNSSIFKQPFILSGIQRKKGEPQTLGFGSFSFIRGGAVTSTARAAIDLVRIGKFLLTPRGVTWGLKQAALQATNPNVEGASLTKIWTPVGLLSAVGGNHLGLHPRRHGNSPTPLPEAIGPEKYESVLKTKGLTQIGDLGLSAPVTGNRLIQLYKESFVIAGPTNSSNSFIGAPFITLGGPGGINSVYGIIPGGKFAKRGDNTRSKPFTGYTAQNQYNPIDNDPSTSPTAGPLASLPFDRDNSSIGKLIKEPKEFKPFRAPATDPNDEGNSKAGEVHNGDNTYDNAVNEGSTKGNNLESIYRDYVEKEGRQALNSEETHTGNDSPFNKKIVTEGELHGNESFDKSELIKSYETVAYGKYPDRIAGDTELNDFRNLLNDGTNKKIAELDDYKDYNQDKRVNFSSPGKIGATEDRATWYNTSKGFAGNTDRWDKIQASEIGSEEINDLVHLWFTEVGGGSRIQFRGAVSGITETFSPSWDSFKYNGRADQAYKYSTFERSLSFNLQVYATSRVEMKPIWQKLERLSTMTMPQYGTNGYQGTLVRFRLGNLYGTKASGKLAFIESLSYTISDETPWEISMLGSKEYIGELPMGIDVAIGLKILGDNLPEYASKVYDTNF